MIPAAVTRVVVVSLSALFCLPTAVGQSSTSGFYTIGRKDIGGIETSKQFESRMLEAAGKGPNFANSLAVVAWSCGFVCVDFAIVSPGDRKIHHAPGQ
jgi:hypothetical protein